MISIAVIVLILSGPPAESFTKAQALTTEGKFSDAEAVLRGGMKQNPGTQGFHLAIGRVLLANDRPAEAYFEYFYEVLRAGSDAPGAEAMQASKDLLATHRGIEVDEARVFLKAVTTVGTNPAEARRLLLSLTGDRATHYVTRYFLAETRLRTTGGEEALKELRALVAEDPGFAPAVVLEAMSLRGLGRQKEAETAGARARKIAPTHWALATLELLSQPTPTPLPTLTPTPKPLPTPLPRP